MNQAKKLQMIKSVIEKAEKEAASNREKKSRKYYQTKNTIIYFHAIDKIKDILDDGWIVFPVLKRK